MSKPITDKAEVSIDFPEKFYMGSFGRGSRFDVTADDEGVHLKMEHTVGEKRRVGFHVHYILLADLLTAIGEALSHNGSLDQERREALQDATQVITRSLKRRRRRAT